MRVVAAADPSAYLSLLPGIVIAVVAGAFQLKSVQQQQKTSQTDGALRGYDELVHNLQQEVAVAKAEAETAATRARASDERINETQRLYFDCENRAHFQGLRILTLEAQNEYLMREMGNLQRAAGIPVTIPPLTFPELITLDDNHIKKKEKPSE